MSRHRYTREELESALNNSDDEDYSDEAMDDYDQQEEEEEEEYDDEEEHNRASYSNIKVLTFKPNEPQISFRESSTLTRKWNNNSTLLLLSLYKKYKQEFTYRPKRDVWDIISRELRTKGYDISGHYCYEKFRNMVRTCRHVRDKIAKADGSTRINIKFPYYQQMAELLSDMPEVRTPTVFESSEGQLRNTGGEKSTKSTSTASTCQQTEDTEREWFKEWISLRRELEQNKERRHRESMEMKRAILEKLTQLEELARSGNT